MSQRDDRGYKVVYSSRPRNPDPLDGPLSRHSSRVENYPYDNGYGYERDSRERLPRSNTNNDRPADSFTSDSYIDGPVRRTTTYDVVRGAQQDDVYVKPRVERNGKTAMTDPPRDRPGPDYEIIRSKRPESDAAFSNQRRQRYDDYPDNSHDRDRDRRSEYQQSTYDSDSRAGPMTGSRNPMQDVQVMEDSESNDDDDGNQNRRGRTYAGTSKRRLRSALRGATNRSPDSMKRRRSRSVGFRKDQINHHDASESRHERPGAEAAITGQYLTGRDYEYGGMSGGRRQNFPPQRTRTMGYDPAESYEDRRENYAPKRDDRTRRRYYDDQYDGYYDDRSDYATNERRQTSRYQR